VSRTQGRTGPFLATITTIALAIVPVVVTAGPAEATARVPHRHTIAMDMADMLGEFIGLYAETDGLDGRSIRAVREALKAVQPFDDPFTITVQGLKDANHDGLDDDGGLNVRVLDNIGRLTLHKNRTSTVADGGFVLRNRLSVLKESACSFDRALRFGAPMSIDSWDMVLIKEVKNEMPTGVRVVSDQDGNHDGYDDDGRLTFLANGKAVTLTIANTPRQGSRVTYGPTWRSKAPKRTHHPAGRRHLELASLAPRAHAPS